MDVYIDIAPRHKAWVQDISPLLPEFMQDSQLFQFDEVSQLAQSSTSEQAEFRSLSEDSVLRPMANSENCYPLEFSSFDQLQGIIEQNQ